MTGCSVLLYPANALADGLAGLWLRRRDDSGGRLISLLGQNTPTGPVADDISPADRSGTWGDLAVSVSLRLSERQPAWFWHVTVSDRTDPVEVDLVHTQDVALAPLGAVRTNEYYVSQYLDLTPVEAPGHGRRIGVRQNMPGPTPWLLVGSLGRAGRWAPTPSSSPVADVPRGHAVARTQHQICPPRGCRVSTLWPALQTEPTVLRPGGGLDLRASTGLDSRRASGGDVGRRDARYAASALADPAAIPPAAPRQPDLAEPAGDHRSLFGTAGPLDCRPLTRRVERGCRDAPRTEAEYDGANLPQLLHPRREHVVTAAKQARVLRPHGHLLRSGTSLLPDEPSICATVWMDGTFCSPPPAHPGSRQPRRDHVGASQLSRRSPPRTDCGCSCGRSDGRLVPARHPVGVVRLAR